jgi:DNA phosphorothioation-dependent restriction protein DptH
VMPQEARWMERTERGRAPGIEFIEARFGREGIIHIPISRQLKVIEQKILMTPEVPVSWRLPIRLGQAGETVSDAAE